MNVKIFRYNPDTGENAYSDDVWKETAGQQWWNWGRTDIFIYTIDD